MKYYYSPEHDLVVKMGIKDDKLTLKTGADPYVAEKDQYQINKDYIQVKFSGVTYKFITSRIKKSKGDVDGTIWLYPVHEEKVVKVDGRYYLFEDLSISNLLRESYSYLCGATLNSYMNQKMDDPELVMKLLH